MKERVIKYIKAKFDVNELMATFAADYVDDIGDGYDHDAIVGDTITHIEKDVLDELEMHGDRFELETGIVLTDLIVSIYPELEI